MPINEQEALSLEKFQTRLTTALIKQAGELKIGKSDWVQGGWSRSSSNITDRIEIGYTPKYQVLK